MKYILVKDQRFVCGHTSFGLMAGSEVHVNQTDKSTRKVLIDFGGGMIDWFHESMLDLFKQETHE